MCIVRQFDDTSSLCGIYAVNQAIFPFYSLKKSRRKVEDCRYERMDDVCYLGCLKTSHRSRSQGLLTRRLVVHILIEINSFLLHCSLSWKTLQVDHYQVLG